MSGTGIRQISHRFKSQTGLLLFSLITDIFGSLSRSISLSNTHPLKADLITLFRNQVYNSSNAFLSRYVMLCHAFRHVITDKWPGRTKHQKKK